MLAVEAVVIVYSLLFPGMPQKVVKEAQEVIVVAPPEEVKKEEPKTAETAITLGSIPEGAAFVEIIVTADDLSSPVIQRVKIPGHSGPFSIPLLIPAGANRNFSIKVFGPDDVLLSKKDLMSSILSEKPNSLSIEFPELLAKKRDISPPSFNGLSEVAAETPAVVRLTWQAAKDKITPSEKIRYLIYQATESGKEDMSRPAYSVTGKTSFKVGGLKDGIRYYFVARAKDEQGNTDNNTKEVKAATPLLPPSHISAATVPDKEAFISWEANPHAKGYKIERREAGSKKYAEVSSVAATSYKDTGPFKGASYYYRIIAYNDLAVSSHSEEVFAAVSFPTTVVGENRFGSYYTSIAISPETGFPRISYYNYAKGSLDTASFNGVSWDIETVDKEGDVGWDSALVIDQKTGYSRIAYYDITNKAFKYASFDGKKWDIETVVKLKGGGWGTFLVLAPKASYPLLSYYDSSSKEIKLARFDGSSWKIETIDAGSHVGYRNAVAVDKNSGAIYVAYYGNNNTVKLASFDGKAWRKIVIDKNVDVNRGASLAVDQKTGYPSISYYSSDQTLRLASFNGTAWKAKDVDKGGDKGWDNTMVLNPKTGYPVIGYYASDDKLKLASFNGSSWDFRTIGENGEYMSMDISPMDSKVFVSYYDSSTRQLKCYSGAQ